MRLWCAGCWRSRPSGRWGWRSRRRPARRRAGAPLRTGRGNGRRERGWAVWARAVRAGRCELALTRRREGSCLSSFLEPRRMAGSRRSARGRGPVPDRPPARPPRPRPARRDAGDLGRRAKGFGPPRGEDVLATRALPREPWPQRWPQPWPQIAIKRRSAVGGLDPATRPPSDWPARSGARPATRGPSSAAPSRRTPSPASRRPIPPGSPPPPPSSPTASGPAESPRSHTTWRGRDPHAPLRLMDGVIPAAARALRRGGARRRARGPCAQGRSGPGRRAPGAGARWPCRGPRARWRRAGSRASPGPRPWGRAAPGPPRGRASPHRSAGRIAPPRPARPMGPHRTGPHRTAPR